MELRVLYLDDNEDNLEFFSTIFLDTFSPDRIKASWASSLNEAQRIFSDGKMFDLVISDYDLSNTQHNGFDFYMFIRKINPTIPFVFFSGNEIPQKNDVDNCLYLCEDKNWKSLKEILQKKLANLSIQKELKVKTLCLEEVSKH